MHESMMVTKTGVSVQNGIAGESLAATVE